MAVLAWVKSKRQFIKIQEGTGDNLTHEDRANGFVDYVLWSTFTPDELDLDEELTLTCVDSGMVLARSPTTARKSLQDCLADAYGLPPPRASVLADA